jgi:hypothetical protein
VSAGPTPVYINLLTLFVNIRSINDEYRKAKHFNNPMYCNKFRKIRNEVTSLVRNAKDKYNNDLIKKNTNMNSSCKNKWNIVKQISGIKG